MAQFKWNYFQNMLSLSTDDCMASTGKGVTQPLCQAWMWQNGTETCVHASLDDDLLSDDLDERKLFPEYVKYSTQQLIEKIWKYKKGLKWKSESYTILRSILHLTVDEKAVSLFRVGKWRDTVK